MALEIVGKLQQLLPLQSGTNARGGWTKQDFVIETVEQYPRKICVSAWGDKARELDGIAIGEMLRISVNIESREFNGRWYTDVRSWRIQKDNGQQAATTGGSSNAGASAGASVSTEDYSYMGGTSDDAVDDLPF